MDFKGNFRERGSFNTPQEEIEYLRGQIARQHEVLTAQGGDVSRAETVRQEVQKYGQIPVEEVLTKGHRMIHSEVDNHAARISGEHTSTMLEEVMTIFKSRGLRNALSIVEKMKNPHLEDDFHRQLISLFKSDKTMSGLNTEERRVLGRVLFEVLLPQPRPEEEHVRKTLKEKLSSMEQFFAGMLSVADTKDPNYFSIEIANIHGSDETVFYVSVPIAKAALFEKQILSIYPTAKVHEIPEDYNIFNPDGIAVASYAVAKKPIFPLKTYDQFDHDPLSVLLNVFSKIAKHGEGISLQFVIKPVGDRYVKLYSGALKRIAKGVPIKEAINTPDTFVGELAKDIKSLLTPAPTKGKEGDKKDTPLSPLEQSQVDAIQAKVATQIVLVNIRIVVSAEHKERAQQILSDAESAFNQFNTTLGNSLEFKRVDKARLQELEKDFIFRNFSFDRRIPLSLREVTTLVHFAHPHIESAPQLKTARASVASVPVNLPNSGVVLGINTYRGVDHTVSIMREDRMRHFYAIGQTGTGKSTLIKNMAIQDIQNGDGVCFMDPHGVDVQDIMAAIPEHRYKDLIYFDPSYTPRPMALNMLEYDRRFPEQKTFVVNEMLSIFNKLFDMQVAGGPMFEQYFRNATMLVIEDPETGSTLLEVSRVLADKKFRELKLSRCKNPVVVQFWKEVAEKAGGESALSNMVPYITSKFDVFLSNDIMRPIIAQETSSFNFREVMDNKKILLVNLAKGRLGDINSYLIGLILVGKILMAALSRVDALGTPLADFYLYIDEFQNVTTPSIATILSEARKYRLSMTLAHQFIAQLDEKTRDAVFGNVGSIAAFRVGATDAEFLEKQFAPVFTAQDLMNIENRNAYLKMLIRGEPVPAFNIRTLPPPQGNPEILAQLKELSHLTYGAPRDEVEAYIAERYKKTTNYETSQ